MRRRHRSARIATLLIPLLLAVGCAAPSATAPGAPAVTPQALPGGTLVDGFVQAGLPLAGARVAIVGLDGQPLAPAADASAEGHFALVLGAAATDFRIVATGGTLDGQPFEGELTAEVRGFDQATGARDVNLVTTLVHRYGQAHPALTPAAAEQAVRTYLGLPSDDGRDRLSFDAAAFLTAARGAGGLDAFLTQTVQAIAQGGTRPYTPVVPNTDGLLMAPVALPVAQFVATNLASGAVSAVGGYGMNQLLGALGGTDSGQLKAVLQKLDTLLAEVTRVQRRLDSLETLMRGLAANTDFQAKQGKLQAQITYLNHLDREYKSLALLTTQGDAEKVRQKQTAIKTYLTTRFPFPLEAMQTWRDELVGHGGASEGLIRMWHRVVATKYPKYYHAGIAATSHDQWAYWDTYQARLVLYLSAAIEAGAYPGVEQSELLAFWQQARTEQLKQLRGMPAEMTTDTLDLSRFGLPNQVTAINHLPPQVVIDTREKRMYADRVSLRARPSEYDKRAQEACDIPDKATGLHGWRIPTVAEFKALKNLDGKGVTFKDMGFSGNLDVHSYAFWTSEQRRGEGFMLTLAKYMQVWHSDFREVTGIWDRIPPEIHTDTWAAGISLLPVRTVPDAELQRYVYPL
ncbi:hypothetical protein D3C72_642690 [compost metagenome]